MFKNGTIIVANILYVWLYRNKTVDRHISDRAIYCIYKCKCKTYICTTYVVQLGIVYHIYMFEAPPDGLHQLLPILRGAVLQSTAHHVTGHPMPRQALDVRVDHFNHLVALLWAPVLQHVLHHEIASKPLQYIYICVFHAYTLYISCRIAKLSALIHHPFPVSVLSV